MPVWTGSQGQGQKEIITRGERTDPRAVLATCAALGAAGAVLVLLIMAAVMLNLGTTWKWIGQHWKWLALFPLLPVLIAFGVAVYVLFIEVFDPNYPPPRKATATSRVVWPWSKEREQPVKVLSLPLTKSALSFMLDGEDQNVE